MKHGFKLFFVIAKMEFSSKAVIRKKMLTCAINVIIYSILLCFTVLLPVMQHSIVSKYSLTSFDFIVEDVNILESLDDEFIDRIISQKHIESVSPVLCFNGPIIAENGRSIADGNIFAFRNMGERDISYVSDRLLIRADNKILNDVKSNPIIIDWSLKKSLGIDIGESIFLPFGKSEENAKFIVAGISEDIWGESPMATIIWGNRQRQLFLDSFGNEPTYGYMYVKSSDINQTKEYLINLAKFQAENLYSESGHTLTYEEQLELNSALEKELLIRTEMLKKELTYMKYATPPFIVATSVFGFIILLLVLLRESDKKMTLIEKEYAILRILGMDSRIFLWYTLLILGIEQVPTLFVASLITKYVLFDLVITKFYLPMHLLVHYDSIAILVQLLAVFASSTYIYYKISKKNISFLLAKE